MRRKIYARQLMPEGKMSPLFEEHGIPENMASIVGKRFFRAEKCHTEALAKALIELRALAEGKSNYKNEKELFSELFPSEKPSGYSEEDIRRWKEVVRSYESLDPEFLFRDKNYEALRDSLELISGKTFTMQTVSKDDHQHVFYPEDEELKSCILKKEDSMWEIHCGADVPASPMDICGGTFRVKSNAAALVKNEIAELCGVMPYDVVLYAFAGFEDRHFSMAG